MVRAVFFSEYATIELTALDFLNEGAVWDAAWPFCANGIMNEIIIGPGAHLKSMDNTDNPPDLSCPTNCCPDCDPDTECHGDDDCLFTDSLNFDDGNGRYKKNGFHAHFRSTNGSGQIED